MRLYQTSVDLPEIQSMEVEQVISYKAKHAFQMLGARSVIVEDTGLHIEAWNGLPGALVRWFLDTVGVDGICAMMSAYDNRKAIAKTLVATYDSQLSVFSGSIEGRIAATPSGEGGFGWDPIFIPEGATRTFAEMSGYEKDAYSMRRIALEAMAAAYQGYGSGEE